MNDAICTLFEGDYHFGFAALVNSLICNGYTGNIYAGYRGGLPKWAGTPIKTTLDTWENVSILNVGDNVIVYFIPLETDYHFTNYKPDFMLELLAGPCKKNDNIFYFDPDICVAEQWSSFEQWVEYGVALCEDVNSPLPENHPRRAGWRKYFSQYKIHLKFRGTEYVNGGFVGVCRKNYNFLTLWKNIQIAMADEIGGLEKSAFKSSLMEANKLSDFYLFNRTDQDALNSAVEAFEGMISIIGQEAMAFKSGTRMMSHALGQPKPWQTKNFIHALKGKSVSTAKSDFWSNCNLSLRAYNNLSLKINKILIDVAKATSRIYGR